MRSKTPMFFNSNKSKNVSSLSVITLFLLLFSPSIHALNLNDLNCGDPEVTRLAQEYLRSLPKSVLKTVGKSLKRTACETTRVTMGVESGLAKGDAVVGQDFGPYEKDGFIHGDLKLTVEKDDNVACDDMHTNGVEAKGLRELHQKLSRKVDIMGDNNRKNGDEDSRRECNSSDLGCKASGGLWCMSEKGNLREIGSATAVQDEIKYDQATRTFSYHEWTRLPKNRVRIAAVGHNWMESVTDFVKNRATGKWEKKIIKLTDECYFYPSGNEPINIDKTNATLKYSKEDFRNNEVNLRARVIKKFTPWTKAADNDDDVEWSAGVIEANFGIQTVPIISLSDSEINDIIWNKKDINFKQYGLSKEYKKISVSDDDRRVFTKNSKFINYDSEHNVLTCTDINGGGSGGGNMASNIEIPNYGKFEAVMGVYHGTKTNDGNVRFHGSTCDPRYNANVVRLVRGDFYQTLKDSNY
ncbi:MAG: hypothetical protein KDD58_02560 [Bdellovibrionales bacterium]|nr:hypothetical protein [Bdellovibrionales bacterium]